MTRGKISRRAAAIDSSGIRRVFDLAAKLHDPINMSIGQPDFAVPQQVQDAAIAAIRSGRNGYTPTQGLAELIEPLRAQVHEQYPGADRKVLITSGTSGGLVLAMMALVDPGDEVILFDPYFVMYEALVKLVGAVPVFVDTYPEFRIDADRVAEAVTERTKMILVGSPANPTGAVASRAELAELAAIAGERDLVLLSDEIYRAFSYDGPAESPAAIDDRCLVVDGFSKTYAMTGWRLGFAHGPAEWIEAMAMIQQYTFVCAPQPAQWAGVACLSVDMTDYIERFRRRRDRLLEGLAGHYEIPRPGGAFYLFPRAPWGSGTEFAEQALHSGLLLIPGKVFSRRDTHFRLSYAADEAVIERAITALIRLAERGS